MSYNPNPFNSAETRSRSKFPTPGPYLARITNHLDTRRMGSLEVTLIKGMPVPADLQSRSFIVRYLSPFYGVTDKSYQGPNKEDFHETQKSYGMWMVPPDLGTTVMVIFVDGEPNAGFWIGCVMDELQNHMIPGIAASEAVEGTPEQLSSYDNVGYLPVAEINSVVHGEETATLDVKTIKKPIHPFADILKSQGLLADTIRGTTSSSARRERPSAVFGISTPGPVDDKTTSLYAKQLIGYKNDGQRQAYVSRKGGSTFVMDDGDINGENELVRIRTRTGHQILMHNTKDLIYIANSKGTTWIELTSNGKIDVYAQDSVSIHSQADFNFKADRDINIEAGNNINIKAFNEMNLNALGDYTLIADSGEVLINGSLDCHVKGENSLTVDSNMHLLVKKNVHHTAYQDFNILSTSGSNRFTAKGNTNILSGGTHVETANMIHMNGPAADAAIEADAASDASEILTVDVPLTSVDAGWENGVRYQASTVPSINQRVPMHEPWSQHESINSALYSSIGTSRSFMNSTLSANPVTYRTPKSDLPPWASDTAFLDKVAKVAKNLGVKTTDLLAIMHFETGGSMDPSQPNNMGGSARGLIQFMPKTATWLGTSSDELVRMSRVEQMDYVEKYFKSFNVDKLENPNLGDLYAAVLWPKAVGKGDNFPMFDGNPKILEQNPGIVTKGDATRFVSSRLPIVNQQLAAAKSSGTG